MQPKDEGTRLNFIRHHNNLKPGGGCPWAGNTCDSCSCYNFSFYTFYSLSNLSHLYRQTPKSKGLCPLRAALTQGLLLLSLWQVRSALTHCRIFTTAVHLYCMPFTPSAYPLSFLPSPLLAGFSRPQNGLRRRAAGDQGVRGSWWSGRMGPLDLA